MKNEHRDPDQVDLAARRNPLWERTAAKRALASDADQIRGQRHSDSKTSRDEPERSCAAVKIPQREKCAVGENSERRASPGQCSAFSWKPAILPVARPEVCQPVTALLITNPSVSRPTTMRPTPRYAAMGCRGNGLPLRMARSTCPHQPNLFRTPSSIFLPRSGSIFFQYWNTRDSTGSLTPPKTCPITLDANRSRAASSRTSRTIVPA